MELFTLGQPQALRPDSVPSDGRVEKTVSTFPEPVLPIHTETSGLGLRLLMVPARTTLPRAKTFIQEVIQELG